MNSTKVMQVLKKIPKILLFLLLLLSLYLKNYLLMDEIIRDMPQAMVEFGFDASLMPEMTSAVIAFMHIFNAFFMLAVFELILYLAYNTFTRRRLLYPNISKDEFALPVRAMFTLGNVVAGLFSLIYLIPKLDIVSFGLATFVFDSIAFILAFALIQADKLIVKGALKPSFSLFARTYGGIYLALAIFSLLGALETTRSELIMQIVKLILVLAFFLVSGLIQARLAEKDKADLQNDPPEEPKEIFKGFGF